jgi:hypothetical protein
VRNQLLRVTMIVLTVVLCSATPTGAEVSNVALGATVELEGAPFFSDGWGGGLVVEPSTVTDGTFLPRGNGWDQGPVWWDSHDGEDRYVKIDLGGLYRIESFIIQADDNDAYELYYWDSATMSWLLAWSVPSYGDYGDGMQTRPNPADNTERFVLSAPIVSSALKLQGNMSDGDRFFSVSEIQAFGEPVPIQVDIDIKPGSYPNSINLRSQGVVPVAVLTTEGFDASTVDPGTVQFADAYPLRWVMEDVDHDGDVDLLFHFRTQELNLDRNSAEATLTGMTFDETPIQGTDTVKIVPSK